MKTTVLRCARSAPFALASAMLAASVLPATAHQSTPTSASGAAVPAALTPPSASRVLTTVAATGVQIYECRRAADGHPAWAFVGPEAELFDALAVGVGTHGAGPFWQSADGSRIVGRVLARADAPTPGAIPWLLLETQSTGEQGAYSAVSHVQRIHTHGGTAPATPCAQDRLGQSLRIHYTADYRFFVQP
jgi:Protein of unknown function (DUF3455)